MTAVTTQSPITRTGTGTTAESATRRRVRRAGLVAGSAAVTTALFAALRAGGTDFTITDPGQGQVPHTFVAPEIAMVVAVIGLAGWLTLAVLERFTGRAARIWTGLGVTVAVLSMVPIWIEVATTATRIGLFAVHLVVALTLLPLARRRPTR